jgi:hypothetical protein
MAPDERESETASRTTDSETQDARHYTGVVIIHGLGDQERNSTLMEAGNALAFWFNHKAGLALRPTGPGRVWLSTQLTEKEDPDAAASQRRAWCSANARRRTDGNAWGTREEWVGNGR